MKGFAVLCGVVLGAVLLTIGYSMAYWRMGDTYAAPLWLGAAALPGLPLLYYLKVVRVLRMRLSRVIFVAMVAALGITWMPLLQSDDRLAAHGAALAIFSAVWLVASLPLLRAGIRYRPR